MAPNRETIAASDGTPIATHRWRSGGEPIVLLHGFTQHARVWDAVIESLSDKWDPVAIDLRGHGDSGHACTPRDYSTQTYSQDLATVLAQMSLERAPLIGHSMGANIALRHVARSGANPAALVLVDCGPPRESAGTRKVFSDAARSPRTVGSVEEYLRAIAPNYALADKGILRSFAEHALRPNKTGAFEEKFDPCFKRPRSESRKASEDTFWRELSQVRAPTLVVRGIGSAILARAVAQQMAEESLVRGQFSEVRGSGHAVPLDNPKGLGETIDRFLSSHLNSRPLPR